MKKIKIFLASSNELSPERKQFENDVYRKSKSWIDKDIYIELNIWEDLTAKMSVTGSQSEYNKFVESADLFVLLAYTKVGMYTEEEFEKAFGHFKSNQKPFIFTYFKKTNDATEASLAIFQQKLKDLGHFYSWFVDSNDLWNQFNKELDRLELDGFINHPEAISNTNSTSGNNNIIVQGINNSSVNVNTGNTTTQNAEKIYNIEKIDQANFS